MLTKYVQNEIYNVLKFLMNHYKKDTLNHKLTKTVEKTQPKRKSVKDSLIIT